MASTRARTRSRSNSVRSALQQVPLHDPSSPAPLHPLAQPQQPLSSSSASTKKLSKKDRWDLGDARGIPQSFGFWEDIWTGRWMVIPSTSGTILLFTLSLYLNWHVCTHYIAPYLGVELPHENPFACLWTISHALPLEAGDIGIVKYRKGWLDLVFLAHQIITFSFLRQSITLYILRPWALRLGIKKSAKIARFMEQSYSFLYYGTAGVTGVYIMSTLPTWYFNTSEFWVGYPHWRMLRIMKAYYLLQFAYWLQQMLILIAKVEKPRKDFKELVAHHIVTLWLIGWSYGINLTMIGNAIFVTMDLSDVFLALAKCVNYSEGPKSTGFWSTVCFAQFVVVWTYLRHWLNLKILWSVWFEFDLIPEYTRFFRPSQGFWLTWWMKYQIFVPILLIQLLNLFWYFLIWRILIRTLRGKVPEDDRSDDEDEGVDGKKEK